MPKNVCTASKSRYQTNQHRNNKANDFYEANNANSVGILRKIKNILEYRSDSFRNIIN